MTNRVMTVLAMLTVPALAIACNAEPPDDDELSGQTSRQIAPNDDIDGQADEIDGQAREIIGIEPRGSNCVPGGFYCGGDKVLGFRDTLYKCNGSGAPSVVRTCAAGCQIASAGFDDYCKVDTTKSGPPQKNPPKTSPAGNNCVPGGFYCGGDKVTGDRNTLYKCNGPGTPTVVRTCLLGCRIANAGSDDYCNSISIE